MCACIVWREGSLAPTFVACPILPLFMICCLCICIASSQAVELLPSKFDRMAHVADEKDVRYVRPSRKKHASNRNFSFLLWQPLERARRHWSILRSLDAMLERCKTRGRTLGAQV